MSFFSLPAGTQESDALHDVSGQTRSESLATPSESLSTPVSESNAAESFTMLDANISDTDYAQRCKEIMALHADLSVMG